MATLMADEDDDRRVIERWNTGEVALDEKVNKIQDATGCSVSTAKTFAVLPWESLERQLPAVSVTRLLNLFHD
jgi:hypothetical protein